MKVTEKDVAYVADLANLELTPEESRRMVVDLNSILGYIEELNKLDTKNVEPMAQVLSEASPGQCRKDGGTGAGAPCGENFAYAQRDDEVKPGLSREAGLANAPDTDGTCFRVPKVIER